MPDIKLDYARSQKQPLWSDLLLIIWILLAFLAGMTPMSATLATVVYACLMAAIITLFLHRKH